MIIANENYYWWITLKGWNYELAFGNNIFLHSLIKIFWFLNQDTWVFGKKWLVTNPFSEPGFPGFLEYQSPINQKEPEKRPTARELPP